MKTTLKNLKINEIGIDIELLENLGEAFSYNPELLVDLLESLQGLLLLIFFLLNTIFTNNSDGDEPGPEDKIDKGKGKATLEEQESWTDNEGQQGYGGGDSDDDDDENKKIKAEQIKFDEEIARQLYHNLNDNNFENKDNNEDDIGSLSSYSFYSSFDENDDEETANKKLDLQEKDKELLLENARKDVSNKPKSSEFNQNPPKRSFDDEDKPESSVNKRSKN